MDTSKNRWCEHHDCMHGPLYVCPSYPEGLKEEIRKDSADFKAMLADPAWIEEQRRNGAPPEVLVIMRLFSGK